MAHGPRRLRTAERMRKLGIGGGPAGRDRPQGGPHALLEGAAPSLDGNSIDRRELSGEIARERGFGFCANGIRQELVTGRRKFSIEQAAHAALAIGEIRRAKTPSRSATSVKAPSGVSTVSLARAIGTASLRVVENDAERMPLPGAHAADAMTQVDAIAAPLP